MKRSLMLMAVLGFAGVLGLTPAWAADPTPGLYTDGGGGVLSGRGSQSWDQPFNALNGLGDVFNSQSWNGLVLGTQWTFSCGVQNAAQGQVNNLDGFGNGTIVFTNTFNGGTFFLSKTGPWGDGINDLTGTIGVTHNIVTVFFVGGVPQQARVNTDAEGSFDNSNCILRFVVANGVGLGDTDGGAFPANYPALIDPSCAATRTNGSWGDIHDIAMLIDCPVPSNSKTWGGVKAVYR